MDFDKTFDHFLDITEVISEKLNALEGVIQIVFSQTADAIIAASIFGRVFYDYQKPCVMTEFSPQIAKTLNIRSRDPTILIDVSSESLDLKGEVIILQLTGTNKENTVTLDDFEFTYPDEINLSAVAYFICSPFAPSLEYIIQLPLISYHCYSRDENFKGIIGIIEKDAITGGIIKRDKHFIFHGYSYYKISEVLMYTIHPFLPGISGNEQRALELLTKSGIEDQIKGVKRTLLDLSKEEMRDLNSNLILILATHKGYQEENLKFVAKRTSFVNELRNGILNNSADFALAINDCIHSKNLSLAISVLLGNRTDHLRELTTLYDNQRKIISLTYRFIEEHSDSVINLSSIRYLITDSKVNWYITSTTAAMALSHKLVASDLPFAIVAPGPNKLNTIGIRASKSHNIENLGELVKEILDPKEYVNNLKVSMLSVEFSLPEEYIENILLEINQKLEGI